MTHPRRTSARLLVLLLAIAIVLAVSPAAVSAVGIQRTGPWSWVSYSGSMIIIVGHDAYSGELTVPKTLEIDPDDNRTIVGIGTNAFQNMTGLTGIILPSSLMTIEAGAFQGCTSLEYATIPVDVNVLSANVFKGCTSLSEVYLPNSLTTIGDGAFEGCESLMGIDIPDGVQTIGARAFFGTSLWSVELPGSLNALGNEAFRDCANLDEIIFYNPDTTIGTDALTGTDIVSDGIYGWRPSTARDYALAPEPDLPFHEISMYPPVLWADDAWDAYFDAKLSSGDVLTLGGAVTTANDVPSTVEIYAAVDSEEPTLVDTITLTPPSAPTSISPLGVPIVYSGNWSGDFTLPAGLSSGYHYLRLTARITGTNSLRGIPQSIRFYVSGSGITPTVSPSPTPISSDDDNPSVGDSGMSLLWLGAAFLAFALLLLLRKPAHSR